MISAATTARDRGRRRAVDERAHHVAPPREQHQRHERERDAERQHDLAEHQRARRVERRSRARSAPGAIVTARRSASGIVPRDEALHHDLAGVGADARRGEPRGQQRERERQRGAARRRGRRTARARPRSCRRRSGREPWNSDAAMTSIDMLTSPATPIAISHVDALEAQRAGAARRRRAAGSASASAPSAGRSRAASPSRRGSRWPAASMSVPVEARHEALGRRAGSKPIRSVS